MNRTKVTRLPTTPPLSGSVSHDDSLARPLDDSWTDLESDESVAQQSTRKRGLCQAFNTIPEEELTEESENIDDTSGK